MDIIKLHEDFKDDDSPSVEGQIRWLQKQGFLQNQIDQALITVYGDIERGETPMVFTRLQTGKGGKKNILKVYRLYSEPKPGSPWHGDPIENGWDLDQTLLRTAKTARTKDLSAVIKNIEKFEADLRAKWEKDRRRSFFKRLFRRKIK